MTESVIIMQEARIAELFEDFLNANRDLPLTIWIGVHDKSTYAPGTIISQSYFQSPMELKLETNKRMISIPYRAISSVKTIKDDNDRMTSIVLQIDDGFSYTFEAGEFIPTISTPPQPMTL